jgi:hypothetical protein
MAFTQTNAIPQANALTDSGYNSFLQAPYGTHQFGLFPYAYPQGMQEQIPSTTTTQTAPTYSYTPPVAQVPSGIAALSNEGLYNNPNAPWAIPQQPAPAQAGGGNTGWDSSAFMQGLQSLGYNV